MNPSDAMRRDWALYYHGTWMKHEDRGLIRVTVNGNGDLCIAKRSASPRVVNPDTLDAWWARPGAYNVGHSAVYLARRARRSARRSCTMEHYFAKWNNTGNRSATAQMMWAAAQDIDRPTMKQGLAQLSCGESSSVAISRDTILYKETSATTGVVIRGEYVGKIVRGVYQPPNEYTPLIKMARAKLQKEGILC